MVPGAIAARVFSCLSSFPAPGLWYRHAPGRTPGGYLLYYTQGSLKQAVIAGDARETSRYREIDYQVMPLAVATMPAPAGEIFEQIESDIVFGRLRPNQELVEDVLMARFQAKRHVVRTVIQHLVARRLAVKPHSKSARVKDFTAEEVREIYYMRALLQREAARILPFPVGVDQLNALKEVHVRYAAAVEIEADKNLIRKLNDEFHDTLFALCGNTELHKTIRFYTEASNPIRSYGIADPHWLATAVQQHAAMIRAIEAQDRDALETLVVSHMQPTRQRWESRHNEDWPGAYQKP